MTRGAIPFVVVVFVAMSTGVLAQQRLERAFPGERPRATPLFPVQPFEGRKPQAPPQPAPTLIFPDVAANLPSDLKPRVVCGMTLIPAPPSVDPKIATPEPPEKPKNPTTYTIRPVQPSICW